MCLDLDQDIVLGPKYSSFMRITLLPCDNSFYGNEVGDECIADKEQQKAYLDPYRYKRYRTYLYYNYETFDAQQHGE